MLNFDAKRQALERLKLAAERYHKRLPEVIEAAGTLHEQRVETSHRVIAAIETYVNELANSPKSFDKSVKTFRVAVDRFDGVITSLRSEDVDANVRGGVGAGASVGLGAATMAIAPAAAMGIATTFGTASTGTAIAALSGAAQVNAALAWLGGGALAAGGGGMAAGGNVLAALGGPVGWGIGAVALAGTAAWTNHKNAEIAVRANKEALKVQAKVRALEGARTEIDRLSRLTAEHAGGTERQLAWLRENAPRNYRQFNRAAKQEVAALVNNVQALSKLLNTQVQ